MICYTKLCENAAVAPVVWEDGGNFSENGALNGKN